MGAGRNMNFFFLVYLYEPQFCLRRKIHYQTYNFVYPTSYQMLLLIDYVAFFCLKKEIRIESLGEKKCNEPFLFPSNNSVFYANLQIFNHTFYT